MKITIYELLGMIKDGKMPKKIKYNDDIWKYVEEKENYINSNNASLNWDYVALYCLKEPVEILEEEKEIPEKLNIENDGNTITLFGEKENEWTILDNVDVIICNKINSIINYLKSKGDE